MQEVTTANFRFEHLRWHPVQPSRLFRNHVVDTPLQSARATCLQCQQSWDAREGHGMDVNGKYLIFCCPHCGNGESVKGYIFNPTRE